MTDPNVALQPRWAIPLAATICLIGALLTPIAALLEGFGAALNAVTRSGG